MALAQGSAARVPRMVESVPAEQHCNEDSFVPILISRETNYVPLIALVYSLRGIIVRFVESSAKPIMVFLIKRILSIL